MSGQGVARLGGLLPQPALVEALGGEVELTGDIACPHAVRDVGGLLRDLLTDDGLAAVVRPAGGPEPGAVSLTLDPAGVPAGPEAYLLVADAGVARLAARTPAGLRHAVQTLRQLAGPRDTPERWRLPGVRITDAPRLAWRGALLDVGRWFLPLPDLRRFVDVLAAHKMTTLHLHLTEDQGWRFESLRHPRLAEVGAWRRESPLDHENRPGHDGIPHGGFYRQAELRALVAYAARLGVDVVPEIDLPGHATAAIAAYPELGNTDVSGPVQVSTWWGVHDSVLNPQEATLRFLTEVLEEVLEVFPAHHVHLGGDECPTSQWVASAAARARAADLGLAGPERLQAYFTARLCSFVQERGRVPVVWDEAADNDGLPPGAVVMAWRDAGRGLRAALRGHPVVMTPQQAVYLDHHACTEPDRPAAHEGLTGLATAYGFDPVPPGAAPQVAAWVLGTQAQIWTEYLPTAAHIDALAFPRLCAIADRAWSPAPPDYPDFRRRLAAHLPRLAAMGVAVPPERMWGAEPDGWTGAAGAGATYRG